MVAMKKKPEASKPTEARKPHPLEALIPLERGGNSYSVVRKIERSNLEREMILDVETEFEFRMVEREYAGRARLAAHGLPYSKNVLLYGPSGCGKTLGAQRIAWNTGLPFFKLNTEAVLSSYLGESSKNLRQIFESMKSEPCLLFIDEVDSLASSREGNDTGEIKRVVNSILQLVDENTSEDGILVVATNFERSIDSAFWRRFNKIIHIKKPSLVQIYSLLISVVEKVSIPSFSDIDWKAIPVFLNGLSSSEVIRFIQEMATRKVLEPTYVVDQEVVISAIADYKRRIAQ
jgi:SpoVK/Ycf46/Vps4 family AAA+-type ATPase